MGWTSPEEALGSAERPTQSPIAIALRAVPNQGDSIMMRSLFAGVSGIRNHQTWLDIIGNNISNVNTVGYKSSRATFAEALAQTLRSATGPHDDFGGTNPMQVGLGLKLMSVDTQFQQGAFETTGNYTDLAIQGKGFFIVSDGSQMFFTRSGAFNLDADGFLTAQGGSLRVQGYMANQMALSPAIFRLPTSRYPMG